MLVAATPSPLTRPNALLPNAILLTHSAVTANFSSITVDMVALDVSPIAVGASVVVTSLIFGIKVEEFSPVSTLVSATGSILKL